VGQVSLTGRALTTRAVSDWQDSLSNLKGIADVQFTTIAITDDNGSIYYAVSATFTLTPDAFANQFVTEK
jgi:Tfp pilus assembly protein PilN